MVDIQRNGLITVLMHKNYEQSPNICKYSFLLTVLYGTNRLQWFSMLYRWSGYSLSFIHTGHTIPCRVMFTCMQVHGCSVHSHVGSPIDISWVTVAVWNQPLCPNMMSILVAVHAGLRTYPHAHGCHIWTQWLCMCSHCVQIDIKETAYMGMHGTPVHTLAGKYGPAWEHGIVCNAWMRSNPDEIIGFKIYESCSWCYLYFQFEKSRAGTLSMVLALES